MYIYLDIVENFNCEMCGICCRKDWLITVDQESYQRNEQLFRKSGKEKEFLAAFTPLAGKGALGEYAYIAKQPAGGCWFLETDNRCRLHRDAGHTHLDVVCQTFPRYPMNTARGVELTLSFSCPAVMKLASRKQPLAVIRSEHSPMELHADSFVLAVYPKQQPIHSPLFYYFELEHHFIDILQCRGLTIADRLQLVWDTVAKIRAMPQNEAMGQKISEQIRLNYEYLDAVATVESLEDVSDSDILLENFLVNFIFRKPFYCYGLEQTAALLKQIWAQICEARAGIVDAAWEWGCIRDTIVKIEFQYGHNRKALMQKCP